MYLIINCNVLNEENETSLSAILLHAIDNLVFLKFDQPDGNHVKDWLGKQKTQVKNAWDLVMRQSLKDLTKHRINKKIIVSAQHAQSNWNVDPPVLVIKDAVDLVNQPKKIILENNRNDRKFLLSMADDKLRERLLDLEKRGRIQFILGGGIGEMKKQLLGVHIPVKGSKFLCWVLFDSDAAQPGEISADAQNIIDICTGAEIEYFCLSRRAIENYIPQQAMTNAVERGILEPRYTQLIAAFFSLSNPQRYHFHLKKGFGDATCKASNLYDKSDHNVKIIKDGFGNDIADIYPDNAKEMQIVHGYLTQEKAVLELQPALQKLRAMIRGPQ